jgi:hypothetical protein
MTEEKADNKVQLGCGTLIIIAIIVMLFSGGRDSRRLRDDLEDVNERLDRIEKQIDELSERLSKPPQPVQR